MFKCQDIHQNLDGSVFVSQEVSRRGWTWSRRENVSGLEIKCLLICISSENHLPPILANHPNMGVKDKGCSRAKIEKGLHDAQLGGRL